MEHTMSEMSANDFADLAAIAECDFTFDGIKEFIKLAPDFENFEGRKAWEKMGDRYFQFHHATRHFRINDNTNNITFRAEYTAFEYVDVDYHEMRVYPYQPVSPDLYVSVQVARQDVARYYRDGSVMINMRVLEAKRTPDTEAIYRSIIEAEQKRLSSLLD